MMVIWEYREKDKIILDIIQKTSDEQEAELEKKYPLPGHEIQIFSTTDPEDFELKKGKVYSKGYDSYDYDS